jgi:hypothetical protein
VISSDEMTSIQGPVPLSPHPSPRQNADDAGQPQVLAGGAQAYLAAYDVHQAPVSGHCAPSTGIVPFMSLVEQVMTVEPYASASRCSGS